MIIVICGVTGSGKTTVGSLLAAQLQLPFVDADDHHPASNIQKMKEGIPLDDSDRLPWLQQLNQILKAHEKSGLVLACSALKEKYRQQLQEGLSERIRWFFLLVDKAVVKERLQKRKDHFMSPGLLQSQLHLLEVTHEAISLNGNMSAQEIVADIIKRL